METSNVTTTTTFGSYVQQWLDDHGRTVADLSRTTGIAHSVISRWIREGAIPGLDSCRVLAETIGRPLLEVLVTAGLLTPDEAHQQVRAPVDLGALSGDQLLAEVRRRMTDAHAPSADDMAAEPDRYHRTAKGRTRKRG